MTAIADVVTAARARVPFYRERLAGLEHEPLEALPSFDKAATAGYGRFPLSCGGAPGAYRVVATSGTTGDRMCVSFDRADWERVGAWLEGVGRRVGLRPDDVLLNTHCYGLWVGGPVLDLLAQRAAAGVVPLGPVEATGVLQFLADDVGSAISATPSYMRRLVEAAETTGFDLTSSPLRLGFIGAEPAEQAIREKIRQHLPEAFHWVELYGLTETLGPSVACAVDPELPELEVNVRDFRVEVLDLASDQPVPAGQVGDLTLTTLDPACRTPLIRYRTRDLVRVTAADTAGPRRISRILGRADDSLKVGGVLVYPSAVAEVVSAHLLASAEWQAVVRRAGEDDELLIEAEASTEDCASIARAVPTARRSGCRGLGSRGRFDDAQLGEDTTDPCQLGPPCSVGPPRAHGSRRPMTKPVVLISTYELGRQPFALAAAAALLRDAGAAVQLQDLSVSPLDEQAVSDAALVALYVPMHTAARLTQALLPRVRRLAPRAHLCVYGLYGPLNERHFRGLGVHTVLGGECESGLVELYRSLDPHGRESAPTRQRIPVVSVEHQALTTPDRSGLPALEHYAQLAMPSGEHRLVGYTEASRGCRHRCRHCPIVPIYDGRFIAVRRDVVLDDVRRQVAAGARHVTFGDPDFFNGPTHALRVVRELHAEFPALSYDVTIKVEHLVRHARLLDELAATGCVLITSAVESFDDQILERFEKQHTVRDVEQAVAGCRAAGIAFNATFVAFTPWTTMEGYRQFLDRIEQLDLVGNVAPVQYGIRLLVTAGSRLLELRDVVDAVERFDDVALCYPWRHRDPAVDDLWRSVSARVAAAQDAGWSRGEIFATVRHAASGGIDPVARVDPAPAVATIPYLTEPWYC